MDPPTLPSAIDHLANISYLLSHGPYGLDLPVTDNFDLAIFTSLNFTFVVAWFISNAITTS